MTNVTIQTYDQQYPISKSPCPEMVIMSELSAVSGPIGPFGQNDQKTTPPKGRAYLFGVRLYWQVIK